MNDFSCFIVVGGAISDSAFVLSRPGRVPSAEMVWPRYSTEDDPKMHFFAFNMRPAAATLSTASHMCLTWSVCSGEWIRTSSMYVITFLAPSMMVSISLEKDAGAPCSP